MVLVVGDGVQRTFIQTVNIAINGIGEAEVATLADPTSRVTTAMRGVIKARDRIFYKSMWEFRRGHLRIDLIESQMWYELPVDYHKMLTGLSLNSEAPALTMFTYEQLIEQFSDLRAFPPGSAVSDMATAGQIAGQLESANFGTPKYYIVTDQYLGLFPIPDEDFVDTEGQLYSTYSKHAPVLSSDHDDVGLSRNLWGAMDLLTASYLKKALEYNDWASDKQIGELELSEEAAGRKEYKDTTNEFDPIVNYNE